MGTGRSEWGRGPGHLQLLPQMQQALDEGYLEALVRGSFERDTGTTPCLARKKCVGAEASMIFGTIPISVPMTMHADQTALVRCGGYIQRGNK